MRRATPAATRAVTAPEERAATPARAAREVAGVSSDLWTLLHDYVLSSQACVARLRSLLDEHERLDALQRSALLALLSPDPASPARRIPADLRTLVDAYERTLIRKALANAGGVQKDAAAALGVLCSTLSEKIKRLGIEALADDPLARGRS